ncbi:MAG: DUF3365 domain-containing protein [Gammaproteobacteria bacterium]
MRMIPVTVVLMLLAAGCDMQKSAQNNTDNIIKILNEPAPAALPLVKDKAAPDADSANDEDLANASAAIEAFSSSLQYELVSAMQEDGPVNALGICHTRAMPVTREVSEEHGMLLSRVSLKYRNPANAPNDWQARVLKEFETRKENGEAMANLSYSEVVEQDGARQFRFMKAIPVRAVCLTCHGSELAPDLQAKLSDLYPGDRATGFQLDDIRGAFVVVKDLAPRVEPE